MAYTMTHILIAEKVLEDIKMPVDYSTYIVGAIAPDAVHASPDYTRIMKEKSHLFAEGAIWGKVTKESEFHDWLESIRTFYAGNCDKYNRDFFLGYIVHVLTDVCSCRQIFAPFYHSISKPSISKESFEHKMEQFKAESYCVNYGLYCEYSKEKNLLHILQKGKSCSLVGVFDDSLLKDRIKQLFEFEFTPRDMKDIIHNEICTIDNTNELIMSAPPIIRQWLLENSTIK